MIDWNIRVGDVLTVLTIIGGGLVFMFRQERQMNNSIITLTTNIRVMQEDVKELRIVQKEIAGILVKVAVQQNTMDSLTKRQDLLDSRFEELRHGAGFVFPKSGVLPSTS